MKLKIILSALIIWFWLLSFSSAWYVRQIWNYWYSPYDNSIDLNVNIKWTLMSEQLWVTKNVLYFNDNNNSKLFFYWWSDWVPYIFNRSIQWRFLNYYICDQVITSNINRPWNCSLQNVSDDSIVEFNNILSSISFDDYWYFDSYSRNDYAQPMYYSDICFSSSTYWKSLCFFSCAWYYCWWSSSAPKYNNIIDLWFFDNTITFSNLSRDYLYPSPWVSWGGGSDSDYSDIIDVRNSSQNLYDSYRKLWYSDNLCYWWFWIDDVLWSSYSSLSWLVVGSGATIFDVYNLYSGGLSFVNRYNQWDYNYWYLEQFRDSYEYSQYIWKSKSLIWLFLVKSIYFKKDDFNAGVLYDFCELSLNDDSINRSKTPIDIINDTVNDNAIADLIWDIGILVPLSGSALDEVVQQLIDNGVFSWTVDDYKTNFNIADSFRNSYDFRTSFKADSWYDWILPWYIVLAFLGFVLLYYFRR